MHMTFMVNSCAFVIALFALELPTLLFCVTLPSVEHTKRILWLQIMIQESVKCIAFPNKFNYLVLGALVLLFFFIKIPPLVLKESTITMNIACECGCIKF